MTLQTKHRFKHVNAPNSTFLQLCGCDFYLYITNLRFTKIHFNKTFIPCKIYSVQPIAAVKQLLHSLYVVINAFH